MSQLAGGDPPPKATEILDYFLRNPQAGDDLEGVARWRLLHEQIFRGVEEVQEALRWLLSQEFLLEEYQGRSVSLFRLNWAEAARAEQLVAQHRDDPRMRSAPRICATRANTRVGASETSI